MRDSPISATMSSAIGAFISMLAMNGLPRLHHPLLKNRRFTSGVTHDKFYLVIECADPKYSATETRQLLESAGGQHLELVEE